MAKNKIRDAKKAGRMFEVIAIAFQDTEDEIKGTRKYTDVEYEVCKEIFDHSVNVHQESEAENHLSFSKLKKERHNYINVYNQ